MWPRSLCLVRTMKSAADFRHLIIRKLGSFRRSQRFARSPSGTNFLKASTPSDS